MNDETRRLKIAFLTAFDLNDISTWSWGGAFSHMAQALQKHCGEVTQIDPIHCWEQLLARGIRKGARHILKKNYNSYHCFLVARKYGKVAARRLAGQSFDLIFAPAAEPEIAFLKKTDIPIILVEDATYGQLINYYPTYSNLLKRSIYELNVLEKMALNKADLIVFCSEWAARSAIERHQADPEKVRVIPFGANFSSPPPKEEILRKEKSNCCRLLFIGTDWERKGGKIAFETLLKLHQMDIQAELVVCGCRPPDTFSHEYMRVIPFLDKNDDKQRKDLEQLYLTSDFLLFPTRNECFGIVCCEASAYGLPIVATNTGGVSGAIVEGENGFMLPYTARGTEYAELVANLYQDDQRYAALIRSSRAIFDDRLNWDAWGRSMAKLMPKLLDHEKSKEESIVPNQAHIRGLHYYCSYRTNKE